MQTTIVNKSLGAVTTVVVKKYGDGTVEYTAAGKTVRSTQTDATTFLNGLVAALNTVSDA